MLANRKRLSAAVLLASGLAAGNAFAQLEEVIVTAQKRTESLQDIPVAISAYNAGETSVNRWVKARGDLELDAFVEEIPYT